MIGSWRLPTPFFISSKPEFLGVEGMIDFVEILVAVGSLILGLFIIRFEMQLLSLSLGKEFGKLRARLVCVFKQQFSVFLKIHVGEKMCGNSCNVV